VAEAASQGTALEEDHTANAWAIFETPSLDINNKGKAVVIHYPISDQFS
jgi:hypothetical protein